MDLVQSFFSHDNRFDLDKIRGHAPAYPEPLQTRLHAMVARANRCSHPFVLPRVGKQKKVIFYLFCKDPEQSDELYRISRCFIGDAYSSIERDLLVDPSDEAEKVLIEGQVGCVRRIHIPGGTGEEGREVRQRRINWVIAVLNQMVDTYAHRPMTISLQPRPTGRILRDFTSAFYSGDANLARDNLVELRAGNHLNQLNLLFLEFRLEEMARNWRGILQHQHIGEVVGGRLPRQVARSVLQSVHHLYAPNPNEFTIQLEEFRDSLAQIAPFFYREPDLERDTKKDLTLWKVWMLGAISRGNTRALELVSKGVDESWVRQLSEWGGFEFVKNTSNPVPPSLAKLLSAEPCIEIANLLLSAAMTSNEHQCAQILNALNAFPGSLQATLKDSPLHRQTWFSLEEIVYKDPIVCGWENWFQLVKDGERGGELVKMAFDDSGRWGVETWKDFDLDNLVSSDDTKVNTILRDVMPTMLGWLETNKLGLQPDTIEMLLLSFASDEIASIQDVSLCEDLFLMLVSSAHSKNNYANALDSIDACWSKVESPVALDTIFDFFDLALDYPCCEPDMRAKFWRSVQSYVISVWGRLSEDIRLLAKVLAKEILGLADCFPESKLKEEIKKQEEKVDLSGKRLAVYTLTEDAARRAKGVLSDMYPELDIQLNHDKNSTAALENLARTSDYFIFSAKSAAHQAFYPVSKLREEIIYPAGKGSSSIVRAFLSAIQ